MSDVLVLSLVFQRITFDLKLPIHELVQKAFTADELTSSSAKNRSAKNRSPKKKKDSS